MLEELAAAGWPIYAHTEPDWFVVALDDSLRFDVKCRANRWTIHGLELGRTMHYLEAGDSIALRAALTEAAKKHGYDLSGAPKSARLSSAAPVSNRLSLVHLCGVAAVHAIFDPYFDDRAVGNLAILCNMGLRLAPSVRVLVTSKATHRLTNLLVRDFKSERKVRLEARVCASDKEHRRFILLDDGKGMVLGCSLNDLSKNEAAHTELAIQDELFFNEQWANARAFC